MPTTAYAILGLLSFGETSGYDLGKFAEASIGSFFSPARSHIYAELRRLVRLGYAAERSVRQQKRPDKRLYRSTPAGEEALRAWVESEEIEPDFVKSPFTLKVFFGRHARPATLAARIEQYREEARERLAGYRQTERAIAGSPDTLFPSLTLKAGIAHTRATIRWADEVLETLRGAG